MTKLLITLGIGILAGLIDVLPMILRKGEWITIASAFTHWVVTTILISYAVMPLAPWIKGALIGGLSALPVLITYSQTKPASVLPILGISLVLGAIIGLATARFAS
ncbi:MAG: hypothetical protein ACRCWO_05250 [Bosea sp. (in: a-proteobacteria)]